MAATKQATRLLKYIRELATAGGTAVTAVPPVQFSDKELLGRFAGERDEVAFTALLHRHGPMVLRVCRRVLRNWHDADDAFQATFLLLARKASAKGWHVCVANWLYQTAYHMALKARTAAARRAAHEAQAGGKTHRDPLDDLTGKELQGVLDEELTRLPEKYRAPLVLCYLEGATRNEAAQQLGWPLSTLGLRLEQGRDRLRGRLERRGLMFSAALSAALITERASATTLTTAFLASTVRAASLVAAGKTATGAVSAPVIWLLQEGLKTLVATKLKITAVLLVALTAVTVGGGMWARQPIAAERPLQQSAARGQESGVRDRKPEVRSKASARSKSRSLTSDFRPLDPDLWDKGKVPIRGQVLDDHGKPIKDAQVAVIMRPRRRLHSWEWANFAFDMADTVGSDGQGRFQVNAPAPTDRTLEPVTPPWPRDETALVIGAPGHGVAWQSLEGQSEPAQAVISLSAEQVLHGRLIDLQGQPAAGVQMVVARVRKKSPSKGGEGIDFRVPPEGLPAWPKPVITDVEGRFTVRGIGQNHAITLEVRDDRFARQPLEMETGDKASPKEIRFSLTPARRIVGRVVYADTRAAVPNVRLSVWVWQRSRRAFLGAVESRGDTQGRFAINTFAGDSLGITAYPAAEFLCRKLYRSFVSESHEPNAELIALLAQELRNHRYSIRHVLGIILRSRHFYEKSVVRQRIKNPVEFTIGLLRALEVPPRDNVNLLAAAAVACERQGMELFYPPNVKGWDGGKSWLNSTTILQRGNWIADVVWGNANLGLKSYDPIAWAKRYSIGLDKAAAAFTDFLLQGDLSQRSRAVIARTAGQGGGPHNLRLALQQILHCPEYQLS